MNARTVPPLVGAGITPPPPSLEPVTPQEIAAVSQQQALEALDLVIHDARLAASNPTMIDGTPERRATLHRQFRRHLVALMAVRALLDGAVIDNRTAPGA